MKPTPGRPLGERGTWELDRCSVAAALDAIGNRISLLLIREAFLGTRRFDDFAVRVGVSEPAAARRLGGLVAQGVLTKTPYREAGQRERHEYRLTEKGRELLPVITALRDWGDRWAVEGGPPFRAVHADCGEPVRAVVRCDAGHDVDRRHITMVTDDAGEAVAPARNGT